MADEYVETEMSKRAKSKLREMVESGLIAPESPEGKNIKSIDYDLWGRKYYLKKNGGLDFSEIVKTLRIVDEADYTLMKLCVKLNLDDKQLEESIKAFQRDTWGDLKYFFGVDKSKEAKQRFLEVGRERSKGHYKRFCDYFEITPDPNFPDW